MAIILAIAGYIIAKAVAKLIKKALVTDIDSNDVDSISELSDINETNAKQSLQMLINIMKKYSQDIDVT